MENSTLNFHIATMGLEEHLYVTRMKELLTYNETDNFLFFVLWEKSKIHLNNICNFYKVGMTN